MSPPPSDLPVGTVTFLRTDVEGSMRLAAGLGTAWDELNAAQLGLIRDAVAAHDGRVVRTEGDALFAAFADARRAVGAAIAAQRAMLAHDWPSDAPVRVRIGLHSGEAHLAGDDYGGFDVNRAARIAAVGHGGQIILSDPTRALVAGSLGEGCTARDLGRHALRDVPFPERLFQLDAPGLPTDFPPLRSGSAAPGNLPPRLTSFVGREADLEAVRRLIAAGRLLTITGPGGIGKTSLAVELARGLGPGLADGAWLVKLDAVGESRLVPAAIARALGVYEGGERSAVEGVTRHLADRETLLVLDNFEHVLDAAEHVAVLLQAAPDLRVVVTSRAPLRIEGEQEFALAPLATDAAAVRLFEERARASQPGWSAGPDDAVVREICRRLDGLPLGIELAAARVGLLSPSAIRDRLAARLPLPGTGRRDVPDRQRTLEGAVAWSVGLLDEDRRRLLRRLAVFDGGFDLDQARHVVMDQDGDILEAVIELAEQSLLTRDVVEGTARLGGLRFRMLEVIRSFALGELEASGEHDRIRHRHAAALLDLAEVAARSIPGVDQARWIDRLDEDHANLRAAVEWSVEHGPVEHAQRLVSALWRYWQLAGYLHEGRELVDRVLALEPDEPTPARMWAVMAAASVAYWQADSERAHALYKEQLAIARQVGDEAGLADALFNLSATTFISGERDQTVDRLQEARAVYDRLGDEVGASRTLWGEHNYLAYERRFEEALVLVREAARRYEANGDVMYQALSAGSLAWMTIMAGDRRNGIRHGIKALATTHALRDVASTTLTLAGAAVLLLEWERWSEAATLMGAYERLSDEFGLRPPAGLGYLIELFRPVDRTLAGLQADVHREATEAGRRMSYDEAVTFALAVMDQVASEDPPVAKPE